LPTQIRIICFTDLQGSTASTEKMGHREFMPLLQEHLRLGRSLATLNSGDYKKNTGDGHLVQFESVEDALAFASQFQQLCSDRPGIVESPLPARVALFQGAIEPTDNDVFGSAVNQASRLLGVTEAGHVTVNEELFDAMKSAFGSAAEQYCTSLGEHELKGIEEKVVLYNFDWLRYREAVPAASLASFLYDHLRSANIEPSNIGPGDLNRPGQVIWPVVPRDLATAIHRGQIELIRLLALLGWEVVVLIADCGGETEYDDDYIDKFRRSIESHLTFRKVRLLQIERMSKLYDPTYPKYTHIQALFRRITSKMTVQVLMDINNKGYNQQVRDEIKQKTTLTYVRPPLTLAAVLHLAEGSRPKSAVIAGSDENIQWKQLYADTVPNARDSIGVLLIPVLLLDKQYQMHQEGQWPIWYSEDDVLRQCVGSNLAWWLFRLFSFLPAFPDSDVTIGDKTITPEQWTSEIGAPSDVDLHRLVSCIWPILVPVGEANGPGN
jgi:class 3 adenylate cyclase